MTNPSGPEDTIAFPAPGMVGKVLSVHPKEEMRKAVSEMVGVPIPRRALVEFENDVQILLSPGMKWEKVREHSPNQPAKESCSTSAWPRRLERSWLPRQTFLCLPQGSGEAKL